MTWDTSKFLKELDAAAQNYDRETAALLCGQLIEDLHKQEDPYPLASAKPVLNTLRRKRYYDLMERVADTFIQSGQNAPLIRRQYAQSLLDQSLITAAVNVLRPLIRDTEEGLQTNEAENAEARGLLGRAYKQMYMDSGNSSLQRNREVLQKAVDEYYRVFQPDPEKYLWHGVNTLALLCRAKKDGVKIKGFLDPTSIAGSILDTISAKKMNQTVEHWDLGTAAEACLALDKYDEALDWLARYVEGGNTDAFELNSTLRQLTEVWQLDPTSGQEMRLLGVLKSALLQCEGGSLDMSAAEIPAGGLGSLVSDENYEKVLGKDGFVTFKWFLNGVDRARAIAKVEDKNGEPQGTGFLLAGKHFDEGMGDELLFITNAHVLSNIRNELDRGALGADQAVIKFELEDNGHECVATEILWSSPRHEYDTTIARLNRSPDQVSAYPVAKQPPATNDNPRVYVIGHPRGRSVSFSIHDNILLDKDSRHLHYRAPTEGGSSGSPVFNRSWELIALHHYGSFDMAKLNGKSGSYAANEGVWIKAIIDAYQEHARE